jgi:hypothetical protein
LARSIAANTYANYSLEQREGTLPGTVAVAWLSSVGIVPVLCVMAIFVPLLFPDGHLPSARWRGVAWLAGIAVGLTTVLNAVAPGPMSNGVPIQNPTAIPGLGSVPEALGLAVTGSLILSFAPAVASVVWRYRHGTGVEHQQARWFALFQPVRHRIQAIVDRRFDRACFDAERTTGEFAKRLRRETDMERVTGDLTATVASAVVPRSLDIWLRPPSLSRDPGPSTSP